MAPHLLDGFNYWIGAAREELSGRGRGADLSWKSLLGLTIAFVRYALNYANRAGCAARKALCFRVLNWLKADLRRSA